MYFMSAATVYEMGACGKRGGQGVGADNSACSPSSGASMPGSTCSCCTAHWQEDVTNDNVAVCTRPEVADVPLYKRQRLAVESTKGAPDVGNLEDLMDCLPPSDQHEVLMHQLVSQLRYVLAPALPSSERPSGMYV